MKKVTHLFVLLVSLALVGNHAMAATISIGSANVGVGGITTVNLDISGLGSGSALGTYDLNVAFDSGLLDFASALYGDPILGDQLDLEGFGTVSGTTPGVGTTELFELSLDSPAVLLSSQASSFTLAALTFNALAPGVSTLTLSLNAVGDQDGSGLTTSVQNGSVTVAPVPLPATAWLLLSGLGGIGALSRRNRRETLCCA